MNSSIEKLRDALSNIYHNDGSCYHMSVYGIDKITEKFQNVNTSLVAGWENVNKFNEAINNEIQEILKNVHEVIENYADYKYENELKESNSLEDLTGEEESILNEIGL